MKPRKTRRHDSDPDRETPESETDAPDREDSESTSGHEEHEEPELTTTHRARSTSRGATEGHEASPHGAAGNGTAGPAHTQPQPEQEETMRRAEEMVDRMGERVGQAATWLGRQVLRLAARAREEAEDIWAEAQALRQEKSPREPSP